MLSSIRGLISRRSKVRAAALAVASMAFAANFANAQEAVVEEVPGSAYSLSFGTDFTSHFISYGLDVWGGGSEISPFSARSTAFQYGTLNVAFADNLSGFVNVWTDLNDNVDSAIGGNLQELDLNTGLTYTAGDFSFTAAHGFWLYAGDEEKILDFTVAYSDKWIENFALNPSVTLHWRYDGNGGQDDGIAVVAGIKPSVAFDFLGETYPLTVAFPVSAAYFESGFQGGDSGLGFISGGVVATVPLAFIPARYGLWSASASLTYYHTPDDTIPTNPTENFLVSALSIGMSF